MRTALTCRDKLGLTEVQHRITDEFEALVALHLHIVGCCVCLSIHQHHRVRKICDILPALMREDENYEMCGQ